MSQCLMCILKKQNKTKNSSHTGLKIIGLIQVFPGFKTGNIQNARVVNTKIKSIKKPGNIY